MTQKAFGFILLVVVITVASAVKIPVTIYYESLCPDSAKFISEQLYPAVKGELIDYVSITWIPYGKATYSIKGADVLFQCHHGPNDCYGNKVHACAAVRMQNSPLDPTRESRMLEFVNCMVIAGQKTNANTYPGERCAIESRINNWENIRQCANGTEGSQLLKKQADLTNQFQNPIVNVPTVVFKNQYDPQTNERAMTNFLSAVCQTISPPQPKICAAHNDAMSSITFTKGIWALGALLLSIPMSYRVSN